MEQGTSTLYRKELSEKQTYITHRLESQIAYYDSKSLQNKKLYYLLSVLSIAANALIPILSLYLNTPNTAVKLAITCLSSLTAVITSCLMVFNSKNLWLKYRRSATRLESLLHQYYTGVGPFEGLEETPAFHLLVRQSEEAMLEESENWTTLFIQEKSGDGLNRKG